MTSTRRQYASSQGHRIQGHQASEQTVESLQARHNLSEKPCAARLFGISERNFQRVFRCYFVWLNGLRGTPSGLPLAPHPMGALYLPVFGCKLETMPGINFVTAAALIAEIGDINRFTSADKLAKYAGIAPVKYSSSQSDDNFSNRRGDRNLNQILFFLAVSQCNDHGSKGGPVNPIFAAYYKKKISEGKTK